MQAENAIEVKNITKSFKVYLDRGETLKEKVIFKKRRKYEERKVLRGISFSAKKGEAIGLIGHNGCGKSTTLKMLSKIMYPDSGTIEMKGRVSSLIELGAGFHPDMSGRENIYINASIFGLSKKEIDQRLDDIIEFSELEEFIDNPVRTYSSGMYMRLAFSVAINVDADILLIDEILAVGDVSFQAKCFNKLREIKKSGTTIVIVSHSLGQIEQICEKSIWIDEGLIREEGKPRVVDPHYLEYMSEKEMKRVEKKEEKKEEKKAEKEEKTSKDSTDKKESEENDSKEKAIEDGQAHEKDDKRWGSKEVTMTKVEVLNEELEKKTFFKNTEPIILRIHYESKNKLEEVVFGIAIYRSDGEYIYGTNSLIDTSKTDSLDGSGYIDLKMKRIPVNSGTYSIDLALHKSDGFNYDFWREVCQIIIKNSKDEVGVVSIAHEWEIH